MKVIIVQRHQHIIDELKVLIGERSDVVFTTNPRVAIGAVPPSEPYVLITGMVFDKVDDGINICVAAKGRNPNGKVALLTTMTSHEEMFDSVIDKYEQPKKVWHKQIQDLIKKD
ncbi:MAG TPA: hypothetical protein VN420_00200 [Candidatus Fimivivens sp.]|nr:hypothetical protein [Candidatus Fimivivens sp.]